MDRDDEDKLLRSVALQNAQAILAARQKSDQELRRAKDALEEETRILELLNETGTKLASNLDLETLVQAVTDAGTQLSGAQFGAFFYTVRNAEGDMLTLFTLSGAPREAFEHFGHPRATPIFAPTFKGEGPIRSGNILEDPRYGKMSPHRGMPAGHLSVRSYLAVPVVSRTGEAIGGLFFGHAETNVFSERAERIIVGIAAQAAIAIDNARLYEQAKRAVDAERAARVEVERVSIMKDEFLATLSHELRTPLNSVLGWSDMLLSQTEPDAPSRRGLETIARNARAQAQLIEDLLDMNMIVSGKIRLDVQKMDLATIIDTAIDSVRPSADARAIRLRSTLDPLAGPVFGDPHRVQQIVWNLLTNAIKFTPKGGRVDVILRRVNSHVELTVSDSGMGIPGDFLPYIFERFRQADSSTTRRHGGLGLGLSIVKQLVELHGGSIRAESAGENQGSTFTVNLPLRVLRESTDREHPRTGPMTVVKPPAIVLDGIKVLVVDDEPDARELIRLLLIGAKADVLTASSADEGLSALSSFRPNVLVSDIGMPERDGYQLMRAIRSLPPEQGGRTPAIALTAFARSEDRTKALLAGFQVHIAKPIEPHELIVTIGSLTGRTGE